MGTMKVLGTALYQWEIGRKICITPTPGTTVSAVHFAHPGDSEAPTVIPREENGLIVADIPNYLLQSGRSIVAFLVDMDENKVETTCDRIFTVINRPKPADYVYTETEVQTWHSLEERIKNLEENSTGVPSGGGSGITGVEKNLLLALFRNAAYTADMSATFAQLEALWSGSGDNPGEGGGDEPDVPEVPDEPVVITYKVTNNLTNVTTTNAVATIAQGAIYAASLSADDGYEISGVTVTMGGEDVTATCYADGAISIPSVIGDIVITAVAEVPASADWSIVYCQDGSDPYDQNNSAHRQVRIDTNNSEFWCVYGYVYNGSDRKSQDMYFYTNQGGARGTVNLKTGYTETRTYYLGAYRFYVGKYDISSIIAYMLDETQKSFFTTRDPKYDCQNNMFCYAAQREITEDMLRAITGLE